MSGDWKNDKASGSDNFSRNAEAHKILFDLGLKDAAMETDRESDFISGLIDRFDEFGSRTVISSKQLFWLRDLADKYL